MLNRRQLRIKVMQALYAFFQSESNEISVGERELFRSIDKVYELYLMMMSLLIEITDYSSIKLEDYRNKRIPLSEEQDKCLALINNPFIEELRNDIKLQSQISSKKTSWKNDYEIVQQYFNKLIISPELEKYTMLGKHGIKESKVLFSDFFNNYVVNDENLHHLLDDKNIYWADDFDFVCFNVLKSINSMKDGSKSSVLLPLYRDEEDDRIFARDLFRKTIIRDKEFDTLISSKTDKWDLERVAVMDVLLMKMALCEFMDSQSIPVKVSMNEYIEISKEFSTPKSNHFINAILDTLVIELKDQKKLVKSGKGLIE